MGEKAEKHGGGCYCGAVRYEIAGPPAWSGHCHCRSCQLALGGAFATWAKVPAEDFSVTKGEIRFCEKTPGIKRGFCGDCGTTLTYAAEGEVEGQNWQGEAWFAAATLDDPSIASPEAHVYVSHQQPWIKLADGLPTFHEF
ncbi:GFA family protein [Pelagibius marinus]|uniref:GFA family protein n=1 Tax=Pelagibius marinus TaxID=2762760 RepID=UPI0018724587|nr:GFA family protein [Pelagibius marinus]